MTCSAESVRRLVDPAVLIRELTIEGQRAWAEFDRISLSMPGYRELKALGYVRSVSLVSSGENFFSHFPFLFADAFPKVGREQLRKMSVGALCFLFEALLSDEMLDAYDQIPYTAIIVNNSYQARAWQLLAEAAGGRSLPWNELAACYDEYGTAVLLECRDHRDFPRPYVAADLIRIISRRCALSKIITRALCFLGDRQGVAGILDRSLDCFWLSECLFDDWIDWKSDLADQRYTWFLTRALDSLGTKDGLEALPLQTRVQTLGRHIYGSGFLLDYLQMAANYVEAARRLATLGGFVRWHHFLGSRLAIIESKRGFLLRELQRLRFEYERPLCWLARRKQPQELKIRAAQKTAPACATSVSESALRAAGFLLKSYRRDGGFADFLTPHYCPSTWVSAHVGSALDAWESQCANGEVQGAEARRTLAELARKFKDLRQCEGWSAHPDLPADAETTAWIVRFLSRREPDGPLGPEVAEFLQAHGHENGGFGKYRAEAAGPSFPAWTQSSPEVSAVVIDALRIAIGACRDPRVRQPLQCLLNARFGKTLWSAYWWEGTAYATHQCISSILNCAATLSEEVRNAIVTEILARQDQGGYWGTATAGMSTVFETAYSIRILLALGKGPRTAKAILRGIKYLLLCQLGDGSWASAPMLRIPAGSDYTPWKTKWKTDPAVCGILVRDQRHLFTTASVLDAYVDFLKHAGDQLLLWTTTRE